MKLWIIFTVSFGLFFYFPNSLWWRCITFILRKKSSLNIAKHFKFCHNGQNQFTNKMILLLNMPTLLIFFLFTKYFKMTQGQEATSTWSFGNVIVFVKHSNLGSECASTRTYRSRVGDNHAFAFFCIFLPLEFFPLKHVGNLLLGNEGFAAP